LEGGCQLSKLSLIKGLPRAKLKFGKINFVNCLPIDYPLSLINGYSGHIVEGNPAEMNLALRNGSIDIAPISSYEYLLNKSLYELIPRISISSKTQADSVMFFFKEEIKAGSRIHLTNKSASSINLLKIILSKKLFLKPDDLEFEYFADNSSDYPAKLLIGDEALKEDRAGYQYCLDLGAAWYELTKLPMVFGLWTANKNLGLNEEELNNIADFFSGLRDKGLNEYFPDIIVKAYEKTGLSKKLLSSYFHNLDYNFTKEHQRSLDLFETYLLELGLK
jgi:chorismate dehydratase